MSDRASERHDSDRDDDLEPPGGERDRAADVRDRAAEARDRNAEARDAGADSVDASGDRADAARDRGEAAHDRRHAALDREHARRERERATLDDLTGAVRRGPGLIELEHEIDRARRSHTKLVAAFVDVVALKTVNDRFGHAAGDRLLRDVVNALTGQLRSYDLVIRYGGDEFVCVLADADVNAARRRFDDVGRELR